MSKVDNQNKLTSYYIPLRFWRKLHITFLNISRLGGNQTLDHIVGNTVIKGITVQKKKKNKVSFSLLIIVRASKGILLKILVMDILGAFSY